MAPFDSSKFTVLERCIVLCLKKRQNIEENCGNHHSCRHNNCNINDEHQLTKGIDSNGEKLFRDFVTENQSCKWNPHLEESIRGLKFVGFLHPSTILLGGRDIYLNTVKTALSQRLLQMPMDYRMRYYGEITDLTVNVSATTPFIPLPDALCHIISVAVRNGHCATFEYIMDKLYATYHHDVLLPSEELVYQALGGLVKDKMLFHTGDGYHIMLDSLTVPASKTADKLTPSASTSLHNKSSRLMGESNVSNLLADTVTVSCQTEEAVSEQFSPVVHSVPTNINTGKWHVTKSLHKEERIERTSQTQSSPSEKKKHKMFSKSKSEHGSDKERQKTKLKIKSSTLPSAEKSSFLSRLFSSHRRPKNNTRKLRKHYRTISGQYPPCSEEIWDENRNSTLSEEDGVAVKDVANKMCSPCPIHYPCSLNLLYLAQQQLSPNEPNRWLSSPEDHILAADVHYPSDSFTSADQCVPVLSKSFEENTCETHYSDKALYESILSTSNFHRKSKAEHLKADCSDPSPSKCNAMTSTDNKNQLSYADNDTVFKSKKGNVNNKALLRSASQSMRSQSIRKHYRRSLSTSSDRSHNENQNKQVLSNCSNGKLFDASNDPCHNTSHDVCNSPRHGPSYDGSNTVWLSSSQQTILTSKAVPRNTRYRNSNDNQVNTRHRDSNIDNQLNPRISKCQDFDCDQQLKLECDKYQDSNFKDQNKYFSRSHSSKRQRTPVSKRDNNDVATKLQDKSNFVVVSEQTSGDSKLNVTNNKRNSVSYCKSQIDRDSSCTDSQPTERKTKDDKCGCKIPQPSEPNEKDDQFGCRSSSYAFETRGGDECFHSFEAEKDGKSSKNPLHFKTKIDSESPRSLDTQKRNNRFQRSIIELKKNDDDNSSIASQSNSRDHVHVEVWREGPRSKSPNLQLLENEIGSSQVPINVEDTSCRINNSSLNTKGFDVMTVI